jgi:uncharacterized membrane protein (DUF4010 family)
VTFGSLGVALGIGLMLGVERERRKGRGRGRAPAGVRTFALVGLLGGLAEQVGGAAVVAVAGAFVGLGAVVAYLSREADDPGMTTEVALVVDFLLGALAQKDVALAAGAGVVVALMLAHRDRLHRLVRDSLSERELHDGLLFAAAALVILPLIPDTGLGPNGAFNPLTVWRLVVIVMAVQGFGYVALRLMGARYGLLLSGFVSGFVSSTATVATMGARAAREPALRRGAVGAAVISTVATIVLLLIVLAAVSMPTLEKTALPLACAGVAAILYAALVARRAVLDPPHAVEQGRAFDLRTTIVLAVTVSLVLVIAAVLNNALGAEGVTLGTAVSGVADSQSAAVSAANLVARGRISANDAVIPVLVALSTNSLSKAVVAYGLGKRRYAVEVWLGLALVVGAAWAAWAFQYA